MNDVHGSRTVNDRPLSERVFEELMASDCWCEKCKAHAEEVRDEIAAQEDEIKALCAHRDSLEAKCEQLEADIDELYEKYTKRGDDD